MTHNTYEELKQKHLELQKELQLYKNLVTKIPFPFQYTDYQLGKSVEKARGSEDLVVRSLSIDKSKTDMLRIDFDPKIDWSFEELEKFLTPIFDLVPHHIVFVDGNGIVTLCNLQAAEETGTNREEIIGKHIREMLKIPDELILTLRTIETKKPIYNQEVLDRFYGVLNTRIIFNEDDSIKRVITMFQSLNSIKETEKLSLAGRLAAGIAHEIRNPLTTVRGYLQFLRNQLPDRVVSLVDNLLIPELDRANCIISDFLNIAKPTQLKFTEIGINEFILRDLSVLLHSEALLHSVDLHFELDEQLRKYNVQIDKNQLLQVFLNLFRNAIEAKVSKKMNVTISSKLKQNIAQIQFTDDGPGIPTDIINHVFNPFFSTKESGTGLGLSLSKNIIEMHKGSIRVEALEKGTCFIIELPLVEKQPPDS